MLLSISICVTHKEKGSSVVMTWALMPVW